MKNNATPSTVYNPILNKTSTVTDNSFVGSTTYNNALHFRPTLQPINFEEEPSLYSLNKTTQDVKNQTK